MFFDVDEECLEEIAKVYGLAMETVIHRSSSI